MAKHYSDNHYDKLRYCIKALTHTPSYSCIVIFGYRHCADALQFTLFQEGKEDFKTKMKSLAGSYWPLADSH